MGVIKNVLAITGGIAILGYATKSAAEKLISNVVVQAGQPQLDNTPFSQGYFKLDLPVSIANYNPFPLGIDYFAGVIKYGEITLSNVSLPFGLWVNANDSTIINLNIDIPINTVFNDIANLINSGNIFGAILNKITLNGEIKVLGSIASTTIPLNNITIPII